MQTIAVLIPLLLLGGATALGLIALGRSRGVELPERLASFIGCAGPGLAFVLSLILFGRLGDERIIIECFNWIPLGSGYVPMSFAIDQLTIVMLLVVTGIGTLIHVYSTGYMKGDAGYVRYFAYLNLFMFFMLMLVLAENLLVLFIGWEGVGLCSYLLIGFWWQDDAKAGAGMKAFIVNRIGDAGFILGMILIHQVTGTLSFDGIRAVVAEHPEKFLEPSGFFGCTLATASCLLLFLGATGKSAQIPLFVWLPDAMAGPTPVSALIHAATMVTAGVYMVGRMDFVYALSPLSMIVVSTVGAVTAFAAGTVAMTQYDIKKVLAYSTVSQLGYMFIAVGLGSVSVAVFHLVTHAFFKACLFLGSGSVIHAMHHEQDMRKMGGLRGPMPITFATMTISALAMAGIPPLAGFFSKDEILWKAISTDLPHGWLLWALGLGAAFCTAVYMGRLIIMTFFGTCRADDHTRAHVHESPLSMTGPLMVLALGAALIGFLGVPHFLGGHNAFGHYVDQAVIVGEMAHQVGEHAAEKTALELSLAVISVMIALAGLMVAWRCYVKEPSLPRRFTEKHPDLYRLVNDKYRVDEFYLGAIVRPLERLGENTLFRLIDRTVIDDTISRLARTCAWVGRRVVTGQTGSVRTYVAVMVAGIVLIMLSLLS